MPDREQPGDGAPPRAGVLRVGLTGGIASGKTTVAARLELRGARVIDADRIAHEAIEPGGTAYDAVVARFGGQIVEPDGAISRERLGALVFADELALQALNGIVHPHVRRESERQFDAYAADGETKIAVYDAALLVETGLYREFDRLVVVACGRSTQIDRLIDRNGLTVEQAEARIDAQAPLAEKTALADYVIETDQPIERTLRRTDEVHALLLDDHSRKFG